MGALDGFDAKETVQPADMPELERYMLHRVAMLSEALKSDIEGYDFNAYARRLVDFVQDDLSAFFFDIRKDRLYCDVNPATGEQTRTRAAYRTVLDVLFHALVRWMAPVLVFTTEETWTTRYPDGGSVHTLDWPKVSDDWRDDALAERWEKLRALRREVTEAIEPYRKDKVIRSSLAAEVTVASDEATDFLAELFISGPVHRGEALAIEVTDHAKCGRCWRHLPEVTEDGALCGRCSEVLA